MEPKTCPHATCGYTWTPRKADPKKCPQCQNSLWRSPRPKKAKPHDEIMMTVADVWASLPSQAEIVSLETSVEPECVHAPEEEKDSLSFLKAKADELLRKLVTA
jgi:hypothetical protein